MIPTVVITGAAHKGQVGEAIAARFARDGFRLVLLDRNGDEAEQRAAELRAEGAVATAHGVDLADAEATARLAERVAADTGGRLDALVHAAGGFAPSGPIAESDPAVFHRQIAINLTTAYCAARAFLPLVRPTRGALVFFTSPAALPDGSAARLAAYAAAKAGVLALVRAVAAEERASGVRANAIAPANVRTAANVAAMGESARYVEREAVAAAVRWLCSDEARDVTGQVLRLG